MDGKCRRIHVYDGGCGDGRERGRCQAQICCNYTKEVPYAASTAAPLFHDKSAIQGIDRNQWESFGSISFSRRIRGLLQATYYYCTTTY
jgi:hypothetical protein